MNNPAPNPQVEQLLREGIQAAQAGDRTTARARLERVVEMDQYNEKGWFWLAAMVDTVEEKRVCLGNVVVINPNNERAQRLLEQLESQKPASAPIAAAAPGTPSTTGGVSRKAVFLAIGLGIAAICALSCVLGLVLRGGGNDDPTPANTSVAINISPQASAVNLSPNALVPQGTPEPTISPTPLPPTWTPVPSPTPRQEQMATPLASPSANLGGKIIMQSGDVVGDEDNNPIVLIRPDGSNPQVIARENERGHLPVLSPDGNYFAYIKYATGTGEVVLQYDDLQGTTPQWASMRWGGIPILARQDMPAWSPDSRWLAFTAIGPGTNTPNLYRVSMVGTESSPEALEQLTDDEAVESWPAFAPGDKLIVYAASFMKDDMPVTELRIYNVEDKTITDLTTNGTALVETAPDWSPDGRTIIFEARESGAGDADIYRMAAEPGASPQKIIDADGDDIRPRFSPDGKYIVFSSNRTGNWDVFVYEFASQITYQLTTDKQTDIANDWGR